MRSRQLPTLLLYGQGPAEDYTNDFELIRRMPGVAWLDEGATSVRTRVLDQPVAGFRNVVSQQQVVRTAVAWFADVLPAGPGAADDASGADDAGEGRP
jgi:hypothetical protein